MEVSKFSEALFENLGQSAAEAVLDAINFFLLNCDNIGCEYDKLALLSILENNSFYMSSIPYNYNALKRMKISFGKGDENGNKTE